VGEAAAELEQVVVQDPKNKAAVLLLADCQLQLGRDAAVVELLGPREEELKDDRLFVYLMGTALVRANDLQRGQAYIDRLFREGDPAEAHLLMGATHLRRNDHRSAVPELEKAATGNPNLPGVHSLLGRALMGIGRRDDAKASFERELTRDPNDFDSNLYLGLFLKDEGRLDEAQEHLKRAGRLRSQDLAVVYLMGSLHLAAGRADEARRALEKVTTKAPSYRQAHVLLATACYRLKDQEAGDRHRDIAEKLRAEEQAREPGPVDELAPAFQAGQPARPQ
jgi:tetratricopeptide (TPR) repeat protein